MAAVVSTTPYALLFRMPSKKGRKSRGGEAVKGEVGVEVETRTKLEI